MCGRYTLIETHELYERFGIDEPVTFDMQPRYNIAPGQYLPVIVNERGDRKIKSMLWGLIPPWAKDTKVGYSMINAKAETLEEKPTWREPFRERRCLVPANGFYEWQRTDDGKQPYYFKVKGRELFSFAGLWEVAHDAEGRDILSYAIITTKARGKVADIHDRMPVILTPEDEELWLDDEVQTIDLQPLFERTVELEKRRVSTTVNNARHEGPELIYPAADDDVRD